MRNLFIFVGLSLAASAAGAVSFTNGSFEQNVGFAGKSILLNAGDTTSIKGWKVLGTNIDLVDFWDASDGKYSIDLSGTTAGGIEQTLHGLTPGLAYQVTFDLSGSYTGARTTPNMMSVQATGLDKQTYSFDLNNDTHNMMYQSETYTFIPTSAISVIQFRGLDKSNYGAVLDNVGIQLAPTGGIQGAVPEPAAWALMLGGFGLTGAAMRRRSKVVAA